MAVNIDARRPLHLTPAVHFRGYETPVSEALHEPYACAVDGSQVQLSAEGLPPLHLAVEGPIQPIRNGWPPFLPGWMKRIQKRSAN